MKQKSFDACKGGHRKRFRGPDFAITSATWLLKNVINKTCAINTNIEGFLFYWEAVNEF
jgi:hypothetical protein